jgi:hypothetical protein
MEPKYIFYFLNLQFTGQNVFFFRISGFQEFEKLLKNIILQNFEDFVHFKIYLLFKVHDYSFLICIMGLQDFKNKKNCLNTFFQKFNTKDFLHLKNLSRF